jgi:diaminopimelate decarboxylase
VLSLRFTPGIGVATHGHIQTGQADSKFGMSRENVIAAAERLRNTRALRLSGLHFHLGSQITDATPFREALARTLEVAGLLRERFNILIEEISPGGGLAAAYTPEENAADIDTFIETVATEIARHARDRSLSLPTIVLEPGRSVVARSGVALYEIVSTKPLGHYTEGSATRFLTIDGGMADNIRPALYGARYTALLADAADATPDDIAHIVGCYCESGDILLRDARVSKSARRGDIVSVAAAGAYTLSMASNYNGALRPEVVLVAEGRARRIQRRETLEELVRRDESLVFP